MHEWQAELKRRLAARGIDHTRLVSVIEELAQHLDDKHQSLVDRGMSPDEAERLVLEELDDEALERELKRAERSAPVKPPVLGGRPRRGLIDGLTQDVRYAARALRQSPGFTAAAVITLALGVGANTAIFSVMNAVMLRPLPYADADRLVRVSESNVTLGRPQSSVSHPNFLDWRAHVRSFDALAAIANASFTVTSNQGAQIVRGASVTVEFLQALRVEPALGRNFLPHEDRPGGDVRVAMLSDGFWRRRFAADPSILSRQIPLDGASYTVVGVLPPSFDWDGVDVFVPLAPDPVRSRGDHRLRVIGRLRDEVTMERASSELAGIAATLAEQYPDSNEGWSVRLTSLYDWLIPPEIRDAFVILLGAVGLVLLIACANVANLLLARAAGRQKELSIRVALGAARWRIVRQLLTESLLLALVAGVAGLGVAAATTRLLVTHGPTSIPRLDEASFDSTVMLFALSVSVLTALVFGMVPAIHVSRQRPAATLQDAARGSTGGAGRQRWRSTLTVVEVALSVALLIGAGLLLRSFWRLQEVDPGFNAAPLMMARVALPEATYQNNQAQAAFYERLLAEIEALPAVAAAATSSGVPLAAGGNTYTEMLLPGVVPVAGGQATVGWRLVSPGYFTTMGVPLRGEDFSNDRERAARSTIISEAMAREYWPNEDPIGRTVRLNSFGNRLRTIIGVAGDVRGAGLDADPRPMAYYSTTGFNGLNATSVIWRSAVDPASQVAAVRDIVQRLDPAVPLYDIRSLDDLLLDSFAPRRFNMYLLGCFAGVALLLAAIGLFGVTAYLVSQRTREIGVRLALGADRRDIFRLILGRGIALAVTGVAIGIGVAYWATRALQSLLFSVSPTDAATFIAVPTLLVLVAVVACYVPARRAMRVDPVTALRAE